MALFLRSRTQVRMGWGGPVGLDYAGVRAAADMAGMEMTPFLFAGLQAAEREWLAILDEHRKTEK